MAVPSTYMMSANHVPEILEAIQQAGVPPRFTQEFLKSLGFGSSNDRSVIGVLKSLGFLDQSGAPTARYRAYRNRSEAPYILADAIREAYSDVFLANQNAQTLPADRVKGILASRVDKGDAVLKKMATTFRTLASAAKWDREPGQVSGPAPVEVAVEVDPPTPEQVATNGGGQVQVVPKTQSAPLEYHYNIQIHLPSTKDVSVYNAIFKSLKEHLL
jgi:hypothetical protein